MKTCCLTGHRPKGFPWNYEDKNCEEHKLYLAALREKIINLISNDYKHFIAGGALGADSDFAEIIIELRDSVYPDITLEIAIPCPNQDLKWREVDKQRYKAICDASNSINIISDKFTNFCMQKRNEYMVNHSDFVLIVWNGKEKGGTYNTLKYTQKKKKDYDIIGLNEFTKEIQVLKHIPDTFTIPSFETVYERIKDRLTKR